MIGNSKFIDGEIEIEYTEFARFTFDDNEKKKLKVKVGGSTNSGWIFENDKILLVGTEEMFIALREALNNLWEEQLEE